MKTLKQPCQDISSTVEAFGQALLDLAREGERFAFVTSDNVARAKSTLGTLMSEFPERCHDVGIAEGNQVGVAAGLCLGGDQVVFSKGFGIFATLRAADQINVDIGYNHLPVRLIADHCGITAAGGATHNMVNDLAVMQAIPGMTIVSPADATEAARLTRMSMQYEGPMYFRMTKGVDPKVYADTDYPLQIGKAVTLRKGAAVTLIGMGVSVGWVLEAADMLAEKGIEARVLNMHTLRPLDEEAVLSAARETGGIITVEDHNITGGLGTAVSQMLIAKGVFAKMRTIAFPDAYLPPENIPDTYRRYHMTPADVALAAAEMLK